MARGLAAFRERRRAPVRSRRRRRRRSRVPCGQRLPQALRDGELRPHRQRLRAHGPHQRRRLGDVVQRVACDLASLRSGRAARVLRRRRFARARRVRQPRQRDGAARASRRLALRRRRRPRRRACPARGRGGPDRAAADAAHAARRVVPGASCGTRSSRTLRWPSDRATGSRSQRRRGRDSGRFPGPRRGPQRAGPRPPHRPCRVAVARRGRASARRGAGCLRAA